MCERVCVCEEGSGAPSGGGEKESEGEIPASGRSAVQWSVHKSAHCGESCQDHHHKEDADERHQFLCQLPAQCGVARSWKDTSPERWVKAVHGLPPEPLKFALSASLGTLPTNANLHTWGKKTRDTLQPVHGTPAVSHPYPQQLPCCNGTSEVQSKTWLGP